jgi:protein-S-isoprenylcysteine O-methyltransferase Ste14
MVLPHFNIYTACIQVPNRERDGRKSDREETEKTEEADRDRKEESSYVPRGMHPPSAPSTLSLQTSRVRNQVFNEIIDILRVNMTVGVMIYALYSTSLSSFFSAHSSSPLFSFRSIFCLFSSLLNLIYYWKDYKRVRGIRDKKIQSEVTEH